jgi:hypothetical protein
MDDTDVNIRPILRLLPNPEQLDGSMDPEAFIEHQG